MPFGTDTRGTERQFSTSARFTFLAVTTMSDRLSINCPTCNSKLKYPDRMCGKTSKCPKCSNVVKLPAIDASDDFAASMLADKNSDTRECPYCSEEIKRAAKKCKHCGEFFGGGKPIKPVQPTATKPQRVLTADDSVMTRNRGCADLLVILLFLFVVGAAYLFFFR